MMAAVHRYEGTVNQVMGDGIMALFVAPLAHEDHAVRACYAALHMQEAIGRYAEELRRRPGLDVQIRVGLHSGEVVVRAIGNDLHMDYTAVGQTTHLAARMEQLARPGTALLTADTLRLVEGYVEVTPLGPVPVKGLPEPVAVYELLRAGPVRSRLQAAVARGLTRFVGRDAELEQLRQALTRAGAGHGQVVAGMGEAGVGKSRLLYEFTRSHHTHGWLLLASHSVSYGKATAYLPVCDLLKAYCHIDDRDDLRTVRAKGTGQILTLDDALQDTVPAVLALFEALPADHPLLALDPLQRRRRTLEALKRVLLRESQVQPSSWSSKTSIGSTERHRLNWICWWRASRPLGSSSWSATGRSISTAGAVKHTIPSCGSMPSPRRVQASAPGPPRTRPGPPPPDDALGGPHARQSLLSGGECPHARGNRGARRARGAYRLARRGTHAVPATVQGCWPPAWIDCRRRTSASSRPPRSSVRRCPGRCCGPSPTGGRGTGPEPGAPPGGGVLCETSLFPEPAYTFKHALTHE